MRQQMHNRNKVLPWTCEGWKAQSISSVHHNWFWFRHYTYNLGGTLGTEIIYTMSTQHTTKRSAVKNLPWKIPHTLGRKRAPKHSTQTSVWATAMKVFLSGADREEPWQGTAFSEKCLDQKKPSTKLTTAEHLANTTPTQGHICQQVNTGQWGAQHRQGFW